MFNFFGRLSALDYFLRAATATGLYAASVFAFPWFMRWTIGSMSCGDACGVLGLLMAASVKPLLYYGFVILIGAWSIPRVRDLGVPAYFGLFVPLMILADRSFGIFAGGGWAFAFTQGVLAIPFPFFLLFALVCIVFLSVAPSDSLDFSERNILTIAALLLVGALAVCAGLRMAPLQALFFLPRPALVFVVSYVLKGHVAPISLMVVLSLLMSVLAWIGSMTRPSGASPARREPTSRQEALPGWAARVDWRLAAIIASVLSGVAFAFGYLATFGANPLLWLWAIPTAIVPVIAPTFLIYFAPAAAGLNALSRRDGLSAALVVLSVVPFMVWIYDAAETFRARAAQQTVLPYPVAPPVLTTNGWFRARR